MYSQIWVKQMRKANTIRFGCQTHLIPVRIKTPRKMLILYLNAFFIFTIKQLCPGNALTVLVCNLYDIVSIPLDSNHIDRLIPSNSSQVAAHCNIFKFRHNIGPPKLFLRFVRL